jgi:hypothetical protein
LDDQPKSVHERAELGMNLLPVVPIRMTSTQILEVTVPVINRRSCASLSTRRLYRLCAVVTNLLQWYAAVQRLSEKNNW